MEYRFGTLEDYLSTSKGRTGELRRKAVRKNDLRSASLPFGPIASRIQRLSEATPALRRATQNKNQKDCLPAGFRGKMHEFTA
ncbi:MAG TPA: hypothetical protein VG938_20065 [Verrucomicrobiae bacterium]|jgi:hypothetical protein|nr:hypothetical protein [Verrucomicrobiae bacterium]